MKKPIVNYRILSLFILMLFMPLWAISQTITVDGVIKDVSGEPVIGASIVETGTTNGVIADLDGNFKLTVSSDATLTISFLGYKTQVVKVANKTFLSIVLQEDEKLLSEVVVVGYGTQRKEAVTGSVASIKTDAIREVPASDVSQALQGRIAGVDMSQVSSKPGSSMQIRIRGTRSLNASNDPLIVLDGIPFAGQLSDINPNDIKSLDILKDASATAIYGSRGANGVLLITTNKGQMGSKAQVSYNGYFGLKTLFAEYPMMNANEFIKLREIAGKFNQYGVDESKDVDIDWQDLLYKNSMVTNHDVSVLGGTDKGSYNFGVGYYRDESLLPDQNYTRYSMRGTLDQAIGQYLKFGFITNNNYAVTNGGDLGLYTTLSTTPVSNPYNADGSWKRIVEMANDKHWVYSRATIDALGDKWVDQTRSFGSYNTVYGEVQIPQVEGLKYKLNIGLNYRQSDTGNYRGEGVFTAEPAPSSAYVKNTHMTHWTVENLLSYDRTFADKHSLNVVALYSAEQTKYNQSYMSAMNIAADQFQFYNLGHNTGEIKIDPKNQNFYKSGLMSYMGRAMYSYDDKYMLSVAFRSDGSSRLAPGHKWHTYPAISAGWNIKRESFMDNIDWLDNLKLRVGYGQTSNQSVDPYSTLGSLNVRPYNFGSENVVGYYANKLPNSNLGWEYSETWNYGLDFSLFDNRLSGTVEYYVQDTKDLLYSINMPATSGVDSYMANVGKSQNKGFEISLNGVVLDNYNGWTWEVGVNLYANKNKLVSLASGQMRDESNWWFVGHPIDVIYDYKKVGLWQENDPYRDILEPGGNAGMIKVEYTGEYDADGKPVRKIDASDRQIIDVNPDFQGGFNTRVAYKGFDLSIVGAFKSGGTLISSLYSSTGYLNMLTGRRNNVKVDYWTPENTGAKYPKPGGIESSNNPKYGSTLGYFDASYLKVRTITLGYNFQQEWVKKLGVNKLRVYATVQNPFVLFSPYYDESGMDPETNSYGNENQAVSDVYKSRLLVIGTNSPATRNYLIGLNVTF